jgi:hypothetical protein
MAQFVSPSQLTGLFKETYGDAVENLIPESAKLTKIFEFVQKDKELGQRYRQPVIVSQEHGISYAAPDSGAFELEDHVAMQMQDAQVVGSQMLLRSALSYDAAARAASSKKAFVKSTDLLIKNMMESLTKRLEISILHGQVGLGVKTATTNVNPTTTDVTISAASFAAGIWAGMENAKIQFYLTSNDNLVGSGADSIFEIESVDIENKKIRVKGTAAGITALDASSNANIYFKGAKNGEMAGLRKIIQNTGTLFNINAGVWNLWKGNTVTVSGQLTMGKVLGAVSKAVQRGLDEKVVVLVNPDTWSDLAADLAALRKFDSSYDRKKGENGFEALVYHGQNGEIEIHSYNLVKAGEAFIIPPKRVKRIGAQDLSFKTPGMSDEIFLHLSNRAGFELRLYTDQCVFVETPARCVYLTGFTNSQ